MPGLSYLFGKVRERGFIQSLKAVMEIARLRIGRINHGLHHFLVRSTLTIPSLRFLLRPSHQPEKRILAIWDFHTSPYSVGDVLVFNEMTMVLRLIHKVDKVDVCLVWDRSDTKPAIINSAHPGNHTNHYNLSTILPVASVNPDLGSVYIFDSRDRLEAFLIENADKYDIWPPLTEYLNKFSTYQSNFDFVHNFYKSNGYIPYLSCEELLVKWAYGFIRDNVRPYFPVVVHLRNHPTVIPSRNARLDCWLEFFNYCNGKFDAKFVLISSKEEIDDRFRGLSNVVISKDFATTAVQDLALIQTSLLFMGVSSGPNMMAIYSDIPYIVFNFTPYSEKSIPSGSKPLFATSLQKFTWEPETIDSLIKEFSELYNKLNIADWKEKFETSLSRLEH